MYQYNKICKSKNVTYYVGLNTATSKQYCVLADFSKSKFKDKVDNYFEEVVAWIDRGSNSISWNEDTESYIDKDIIKHFAVTK